MTEPIKPPALTNMDGLTNVMTGLGTEKSKRSYNQWQYSNLTDFTQLDACYQSNWIARKICDIPAEDMTREWRRIKCDDAEKVSALEQELLVPNLFQEAATWSALYGGAGILMITNQDLTKPLDVNKIGKGDLKRLVVLDRYDMQSGMINTWDILAPNYLRPEYYNVRGGSIQVHYTHFARFMGERLPLRQMAITQGWGDSKLRKCIEDITDMVAAKNGISELMQEANIDVITRTGLTDELSTDQDDAIIQRYELFSMMKSSIQMALLDGEEKFDRMTLNLSGVAPIIEQFMTWISGAADIPLTRMFGTSAKGMNATGEGDDKNYNNSIRAGQRKELAEPMRTLDQVMVRSALGTFPDDFDYVWNPLAQPDEASIATANKTRAETNMLYLDAGIVQKSQIMRELQANEEYQFDEAELDELEGLEEGNMFDEPVDETEQGVMMDSVNNGFASVKPSVGVADKIVKHLKSIGIVDCIDADKLHVTLMYSKNKPITSVNKPNVNYNASQTGEPLIMGNDPWRALVIKLNSDELHGRFVELMLDGAEHSYPDFTPHLSLKYSPTESDLQTLIDNPIDIGDIILTGEKFEPIG